MTVDYEKVKKILRLLESDQMGERANAAAMLTRIAQGAKMNLDELMAKAYASSAPQPKQNSAWGNTRNKPDDPPWYTDAEQRQREANNQRRQRAEREQREANERYAEGVRREQERQARERAQKKTESVDDDELLNRMEAMLDKHGNRMLTAWEREFTGDILGRKRGFYGLSDKQRAVVERILGKYRAYEAADF